MTYTIGNDGSLQDSRVFADLGSEGLDGICLDAAGAVWVATYRTCHFLRVLPGGDITDLLEATDGRRASACMLGGPERRTLFMTSAHVPLNSQGTLAENVHDARGFIETLDVDVPGCGLP
jgi:sugar lactone lactonase YvrE